MNRTLQRLFVISLLCSMPSLAIAQNKCKKPHNTVENQAENYQIYKCQKPASASESHTRDDTDRDTKEGTESHLPDMAVLESKLRQEFYDADAALWLTIAETNRSLDLLIHRVDELVDDVSDMENTIISDTPNGTWSVVHDGAGTNTLTLPGGWTKYRASHSYSGSRVEAPTWRDIEVAEEEGNYGDKLGGWGQGSNEGSCPEPALAFADNNETVQEGSITWQRNAVTESNLLGCPTNAQAAVYYFEITKFEVYYP